MALKVKIATEESELEAVCRLNYRTFVEEIPQHGENTDRSLIDRFHAENTYFLCLDGEDLVGMVALRDRRPFSLDAKLPGLEALLPPFRSACEIRLLTIRPDRRKSLVFGRLMQALIAHCLEGNYDIALISGRLENIPIYAKVGFQAFGPRVGKPGAWYQPMYIDRAALNRSLSFVAPSDAGESRGQELSAPGIPRGETRTLRTFRTLRARRPPPGARPASRSTSCRARSPSPPPCGKPWPRRPSPTARRPTTTCIGGPGTCSSA
jgi:hypothetical protein